MVNSFNEPSVEDVTWQYLPAAGIGGKLAGKAYNTFQNARNLKRMLEFFYDRNNPNLEKMPDEYTGNRTLSDVLNHLGNNNEYQANVKTPIENVIFNENNLSHLFYDNEPARLKSLNQIKRTLEQPYYIIRERLNGKDYNGYYKPYLKNNGIRGHFEVIKNAKDGNFYSTSRPIQFNNLNKKIKGGKVIYDLSANQTAPISKDMSVTNIINDNLGIFNRSGLFNKIMDLFKK